MRKLIEKMALVVGNIEEAKLPVVTFLGKEYYVDAKLQEFRAVDNPHDRIPLKDIEKMAKDAVEKKTGKKNKG